MIVIVVVVVVVVVVVITAAVAVLATRRINRGFKSSGIERTSQTPRRWRVKRARAGCIYTADLGAAKRSFPICSWQRYQNLSRNACISTPS